MEPLLLTVSITREADFYLTKIVARTVLVGGTSRRASDFLIRDSSNDRQWSNVAVANPSLGAGTAQHCH